MKQQERNSPIFSSESLLNRLISTPLGWAALGLVLATASAPSVVQAATPQEVPVGPSPGPGPSERNRGEIEQGPPAPPQEQRPPQPQPSETGQQAQKLPKLRWGSFLVHPEIAASVLYDDNIYATRNNEKSDTVGILTPSIAIKSDWVRHRLDFKAGADLSRYHDYTGENTSDYWTDADGRYDISGNSNVFGGLGYSRQHEDRTSPDAVAGLEPTVYTVGSGYAGLFHNFGRASIRFGGTYEQLKFRDVPSLTGIIHNQYRNRVQTALGARWSYKLRPGAEWFVQTSVNRRRYDSTPDGNGIDRNSDGYTVAIGLKRSLGETLRAEGFIGYLAQNYKDSQIPDIHAPDFSARIKWDATQRTRVSAYLNRSVEETTLNHASGYLYTRASIRAEHQLRPDLSVNALLYAGRAAYQGDGRTDDTYMAGIGAKYRMSRHWYLETEYRWNHRNSTDPAGDYFKNQVFLRLRGVVSPATELQRPPLPTLGATLASAASYPGLYLGVQAGHGALNAATQGPRGGGGGTDDGDVGALGGTYGLFGGWGLVHKRWYFGVELAAEDSNNSFYHKKDKLQSRTYSVDKNRSYAASARLGYVLRNGALFYGRLGAVRTTFHTFYTVNQYPANAVDQDFTQTGTRYGVGLEVPAWRRAFLRMDYSYTDYRAYNVNYVTGVENFRNNETLFRMGLGWRFGGQLPKQAGHTVPSYRGFYAGAQLGQADLATLAYGIHHDGTGGTVGPPVPFTSDFGNRNGVIGAFVGYGVTIRHWYAGLELEANGGDIGWFHVRGQVGGGSGGRDFSVERKGEYGASARIGYVLTGGTLLYGRVGAVQAKFNTKYVKGGNASAWIDRDDTQPGTVYAVGIEVPTAKDLFLRMDYSYTRYDSYGFTTIQTNADTMTFKNEETRFGLGLLWRF